MSRAPHRGPSRLPAPWTVALCVLLALVLALGAACERRGQETPASGAPAAHMLVTADYGAQTLLDTRVEPDGSVMRALRDVADVRTEYGGGFVAEMFGRASDLGAQRDWFLFVDGLLSPVGARDVSLRTGMDVWWDHRRWGTLDDPWAVVGSWPAPFTAPAPTVHAEEPLAAALEDAGARLSDDADSPWRVRVGSSDAIAAREPAWRAALDDPSAAGLTAWFSGGAVVALDATSGESTPVPGAGALVAAVPTDGFPENGVVMVVAGVDEQAAAAAAAALADDPGLVRAAYALVLDRDGTPLRAGGRVGG